MSSELGRPLAGARVVLTDFGRVAGMQLPTATTGPDGSFQLKGLKEGAVRIIAIAPDRPVLVVDTKAGENVELRWK